MHSCGTELFLLCQQLIFLLRGVWEYTSSLQAYLWTKIQIVCQVQLLTSWSCWTWSDILDCGGISHMLLSGSERTSPPTLDSNLIHGEVWRAWWCWLDSAVSHRWKWSEVCKIEFTVLRRALGHKRLCTQMTFSAQSHLVQLCCLLVNGKGNPSIYVGISSSSILAPHAL